MASLQHLITRTLGEERMEKRTGTVQVSGYRRADGTYVHAYSRRNLLRKLLKLPVGGKLKLPDGRQITKTSGGKLRVLEPGSTRGKTVHGATDRAKAGAAVDHLRAESAKDTNPKSLGGPHAHADTSQAEAWQRAGTLERNRAEAARTRAERYRTDPTLRELAALRASGAFHKRGHHDVPNKPGVSNWVEDAGGLPAPIRDVAGALIEKRGFTTSHAIATAVSKAKKWCATGNGTYCKAVAQWEKMRGHAAAKDLVKSADWTAEHEVEAVMALHPGIREKLCKMVDREFEKAKKGGTLDLPPLPEQVAVHGEDPDGAKELEDALPGQPLSERAAAVRDRRIAEAQRRAAEEQQRSEEDAKTELAQGAKPKHKLINRMVARRQKAGKHSGEELREYRDKLHEHFADADDDAPEFEAALTELDGGKVKKSTRDGDGDGFVNDGTPQQRPAMSPADALRTLANPSKIKRGDIVNLEGEGNAVVRGRRGRQYVVRVHGEKIDTVTPGEFLRHVSPGLHRAEDRLAAAEYKLEHWEDFYDDGELIHARQQLPKLRAAAKKAARELAEAKRLGRNSQSPLNP